MGASDDWHIIDSNKTQADIESQWPAINEHYCWEHGHAGYSGTLAEKPEVSFPCGDKPFPTIQAAEDWVIEHNDKWGPAFAVRVAEHESTTFAGKTIKAHWRVGGWCSS